MGQRGDRRGTLCEVSETLLCNRQRDKSLLETSPTASHLRATASSWGRGYGAARTSTVMVLELVQPLQPKGSSS